MVQPWLRCIDQIAIAFWVAHREAPCALWTGPGLAEIAEEIPVFGPVDGWCQKVHRFTRPSAQLLATSVYPPAARAVDLLP